MLGAAEKNIDPVGRLEEANLLVLVAANQGHDDDPRFFALEIVDGRQTEELTHLRFLQRLPLVLRVDVTTNDLCIVRLVSSNLRAVRGAHLFSAIGGKLWNIQAIFGQSIHVSIAQGNLKVLAHCRHQSLELAGVGRQDGNIALGVLSLPDKVAGQCVHHFDFPPVRLRLFVLGTRADIILCVSMVEPKHVVPHAEAPWCLDDR
jgi:hypothetical protein